MYVSVSNGEHGRFLSIQAQDFIEESWLTCRPT